MAKVNAPLLSLEASGKLGGSIVYSRWKGRAYVRTLTIPHNPKTPLQEAMRAMMKGASQWFMNNVIDAPLASWEDVAKKKQISPFNAFIGQALKNVRDNISWQLYATATDGDNTLVAAPGSFAATAQVRTVKLTWVEPSNHAEISYVIYRSTDTGFTPQVADIVAVLPGSKLLYEDQAVIAGTTYYYKMAGANERGNIGTLTSQVSATPTSE